ncbi:MAG TPA: TerC family protein [Myxococcaceae bacterium]|nr:TerC family protein [Myxococcaceae bacterium]
MFDLAPFFRLDGWISLLTLTALEVVLGIDNLVFLSIMTGKLPQARQPFARRLGLGLALVMRVLLLLAMSWLVTLQTTLFTVLGEPISGRDLILIGGGLFLVGKATHEIFDRMEVDHSQQLRPVRVSFGAVVIQIVLLDLVFSIDSVITAVGMARALSIMVAAVVIAVMVMLAFAAPISAFVERHPSVKILALAFLILIGVVLVADGMGQHIPKGYVYFAMAFSLGVELLNIRLRSRQAPVKLHGPLEADQ